MEGKTKSIYYKDLTEEEKALVDNEERKRMLINRNEFINDPRYKNKDPEKIWYFKLDYINNWKYSDNYLFTKCECGSLEFDCLDDEQHGLNRKCVMRCTKCGKTHIEYN